MRGTAGFKQRMKAAREAGISVSAMLGLLKEQGVDFEAVKEARRISTAKPYGGKQSPNTKPVRREPTWEAMMEDLHSDQG